jgi:hypothetical protein
MGGGSSEAAVWGEEWKGRAGDGGWVTLPIYHPYNRPPLLTAGVPGDGEA